MIDEPDEPDEEHEPLETEQPTVDAGNPAAVKKRRTKAQLQEREAERFWQGVFQSEIGRREMWKILQGAHAFETRFACGPNGFPQTESTWFQAGIQDFGLRLYLTWSRSYRAGVLLMHEENDSNFAKQKS